MGSKFLAGTKVRTKDGKIYTVDDADGGMVYCSSAGGGEAEFAETALLTEAEWAAQADGRRDLAYARIRQAKNFTTARITDRAGAERLLGQADRLIPGLTDYAAFTAAARVLTDAKDFDAADSLSIVKCRAIFDALSPEIRAGLLTGVLGLDPAMVLSAAKLGDNMARAMMDRGLETQAQAFEDFCDRPRR